VIVFTGQGLGNTLRYFPAHHKNQMSGPGLYPRRFYIGNIGNNAIDTKQLIREPQVPASHPNWLLIWMAFQISVELFTAGPSRRADSSEERLSAAAGPLATRLVSRRTVCESLPLPH